MTNFTLIYPMFAMVVLTLSVFLLLFNVRAKSVKQGVVNPSYFRLYQNGQEPDTSVKLSRHFANIFEAPTLFYIACLSAIVTGQETLPFVFLAWLYVILRAIHAYIHTGHNRLKPRIYAYFSGWTVLFVMWVYLVIGVAMS